MGRIRENFAEKWGLPKDVICDLPRVSLSGDKEIFIENHKGILEYTAESVRIKMHDGLMNIKGEKLRIREMQTDRLLITGDFLGVEYEKIGRKGKNVQKNL